jgi:hypothetical protein
MPINNIYLSSLHVDMNIGGNLNVPIMDHSLNEVVLFPWEHRPFGH